MINDMEKIIFLDIDGVLTNGTYIQTILKEHNNEEDTIKRHIMELDPTNIANVNKIIAATNAKVVITSTIRDKAYFPGVLKFLLENNIPVIATTKVLNYQKGEEIKRFLKENPVNKYIILDDDTDMLDEQANVFLHIDDMVGITHKDVEKAIKILNEGD